MIGEEDWCFVCGAPLGQRARISGGRRGRRVGQIEHGGDETDHVGGAFAVQRAEWMLQQLLVVAALDDALLQAGGDERLEFGGELPWR